MTASAFVATIDAITRFRSAHEREAYLGVASERSSGEKRQLGRITKAGNGRMRWLLVEAKWQILRSKSPTSAALMASSITWNVSAYGVIAKKSVLSRRIRGVSGRDETHRRAMLNRQRTSVECVGEQNLRGKEVDEKRLHVVTQ